MDSEKLPDNHQHHNHSNCNETITCQDCLDALQMVIDNEEEPSDSFKQHLKDCLPCLEKYNLDKAIKDILHKKCNKKELPAGLVDSIKARIIDNVKG